MGSPALARITCAALLVTGCFDYRQLSSAFDGPSRADLRTPDLAHASDAGGLADLAPAEGDAATPTDLAAPPVEDLAAPSSDDLAARDLAAPPDQRARDLSVPDLSRREAGAPDLR